MTENINIEDISPEDIKISNIIIEGDTWHIYCSCPDCDWTLYPTAWMTPEKLESEKSFLISLYQEHHDGGECKSEILCDFELVT